MSRPVEGDFQITARVLTRPTATNEYAKAGVMIRESLQPGARNAYLPLTAAHGLAWQWRSTPNDATDSQPVLEPAALKLPLLLRLTRHRNAIAAEYSTDGGRRFQPAGGVRFEEPLPRTLLAGLAATAHDRNQVTEARFRGLEIEQR